jgi:cytochrome c oxidase accessory protein FixG
MAAPQESPAPNPLDFTTGMVLPTLNEDGSRRWINPRPSNGRFLTRRRAVAIGLIALFTMLPHVTINDKPAILLDLVARRFTFFGLTLLPNDTLLLALFLVCSFLSIFFITAIFGRVWCGWACPQTVYMEFVYRPIQRFFDGTPGRANKGSFVGSPLARGLKYLTFLAISCFLAHTFLAYFVGVDKLRVWVTQSPFDHPTPFFVMLFVVVAMMVDFAFFREQICMVACPYGRFQSVLLDRFSWIVAYDKTRGEPRGKGKATADVSLNVIQDSRRGDCVDCNWCVATCPTGIDIRNGLQMECIHCTQCIDACDSVMTKLGRATGLIRYASQAELSGDVARGAFKLRPRLVIYPAIVTLLLSLGISILLFRGPLSVSVSRSRGVTFSQLPGGVITNPLSIKVINRRETQGNYHLIASPRRQGAAGHLMFPAETASFVLNGGEARLINTVVEADLASFVNGSMPITISVVDDTGATVAERMYNLQGPMQRFDKAGPPAQDKKADDGDADHPKDGSSPEKEEHSK